MEKDSLKMAHGYPGGGTKINTNIVTNAILTLWTLLTPQCSSGECYNTLQVNEPLNKGQPSRRSLSVKK